MIQQTSLYKLLAQYTDKIIHEYKFHSKMLHLDLIQIWKSVSIIYLIVPLFSNAKVKLILLKYHRQDCNHEHHQSSYTGPISLSNTIAKSKALTSIIIISLKVSTDDGTNPILIGMHPWLCKVKVHPLVPSHNSQAFTKPTEIIGYYFSLYHNLLIHLKDRSSTVSNPLY